MGLLGILVFGIWYLVLGYLLVRIWWGGLAWHPFIPLPTRSSPELGSAKMTLVWSCIITLLQGPDGGEGERKPL